MPYVSGWLSMREIEQVIPTVNKVLGNDSHSLRECEWDEVHRDALIKELIDNKYVICGDTHQSPDYTCVPLFNDGYSILSMRTWGDVMAEAYAIRQKNDDIDKDLIIPDVNYMSFYTASTCLVPERLPGKTYD